VKFNDGIVELDSIETVEEAAAYIEFLGREVQRHADERKASEYSAECERDDARNYYVDARHAEALAAFWDSAAGRHQSDIDASEKRIAQVKEKFQL